MVLGDGEAGVRPPDGTFSLVLFLVCGRGDETEPRTGFTRHDFRHYISFSTAGGLCLVPLTRWSYNDGVELDIRTWLLKEIQLNKPDLFYDICDLSLCACESHRCLAIRTSVRTAII